MLNDTPLSESITRRDFTLKSALALLAGVVITLDGCGGSSPSAPTPAGGGGGGASSGDIPAAISANHGHAGTITGAQVTAGNAISLDIQGQATHSHTVDLTQAELHSLQTRQQVSKDSSNNTGHSHTVTFTPV
jgi:hypothetical protein